MPSVQGNLHYRCILRGQGIRNHKGWDSHPFLMSNRLLFQQPIGHAPFSLFPLPIFLCFFPPDSVFIFFFLPVFFLCLSPPALPKAKCCRDQKDEAAKSNRSWQPMNAHTSQQASVPHCLEGLTPAFASPKLLLDVRSQQRRNQINNQVPAIHNLQVNELILH